MSAPTATDLHPMLDAVEGLAANTEVLCSGDVWQLRGDQLAGVLERVERIGRRLGFGGLRVLAEMHARGVAMQEAGLPTKAFLVDRLRISPTVAGRRLRALDELIPRRNMSGEVVPALLPTTAAGVVEGELSEEHASVISHAIRKLPTSLDTATRIAAEVTLGTQARTLDPGQLRKVARRLHEHLDPDGAVEDDKPSRNRLLFHRDLEGGYDVRGHLDPELTALAHAVLEPLAQRRPTVEGERDTRTKGRRMADAFAQLLRFASESGTIPTVAGERPHIVVTINLDDLRGDMAGDAVGRGDRVKRNTGGVGALNTGDTVTPETARRLACQAKVIPVLLGSQGEPLDIGRLTRTIPPGIRRAVIARDRGCIHVGCDQPGSQIHHVRHWADGGPTAVENLVLLCDLHHWIVHHEGWQITFIGSIPYVIPPPIIDPLQKPRRNTMHDIPSLVTA